MKDSEAKKILMALDGLAAYLETIRNLVISSIDAEIPAEPEPAPQPKKKSKAEMIMGMMPDEKCIHETTLELETLGGISVMCNDCGVQL